MPEEYRNKAVIMREESERAEKDRLIGKGLRYLWIPAVIVALGLEVHDAVQDNVKYLANPNPADVSAVMGKLANVPGVHAEVVEFEGGGTALNVNGMLVRVPDLEALSGNLVDREITNCVVGRELVLSPDGEISTNDPLCISRHVAAVVEYVTSPFEGFIKDN